MFVCPCRYCCYLYFQLKTHAGSFDSRAPSADLEDQQQQYEEQGRNQEEEEFMLSEEQVDAQEAQAIKEEGPYLSVAGALFGLSIVTVLVAICSEYLTGALEAVSETTNINKSFLGLIVLPIAGNAAEHFTAVFFAMKNRMDAATAISIGSSIQIAVFVLPVTVVVGWCIGSNLTLAFDPFAVLMMTLSVILSYFVTSDGYSNWLLGLQLILTYIIIGSVFFFEQETHT